MKNELILGSLIAILALNLILNTVSAENMTMPINISNKTSMLGETPIPTNLSNTTAQGNISENTKGTFNASQANNAMLSNSS